MKMRVARRDGATNRIFALTLHVILSRDFSASRLVGTHRISYLMSDLDFGYIKENNKFPHNKTNQLIYLYNRNTGTIYTGYMVHTYDTWPHFSGLPQLPQFSPLFKRHLCCLWFDLLLYSAFFGCRLLYFCLSAVALQVQAVMS